MKLLVLLSFLSVSAVSNAAFLVGKCGDHWLNASFEVDTEIGVATVAISGDSGADRSFNAYVTKADFSGYKLVGGNSYLSLHDVAGHYSARYSEDGQTEINLGSCLVNKK